MHEILARLSQFNLLWASTFKRASPCEPSSVDTSSITEPDKLELLAKVIRVFLASLVDLHEGDVQGNPHGSLVDAVKLDGDISEVAG
jgi:hypothetical protein